MTNHRDHFRSSDAFIAFLGLDVRIRDSGQPVGVADLPRKATPSCVLDLAVLSAKAKAACNAFYQRHLNRGLKPIQALDALARTFARVAFAFMQHHTDDPPELLAPKYRISHRVEA